MPFGTEIVGPVRVLYIEDDLAFATLVKRALARRGHEMVHATSGDQGLARLAAGDIDIIALDHTLPGETGFDILARVGPRGSRPPIVYVTASSDARIAVDALKRGADDYVVKDAAGDFLDLLIATLEQALERWRLKRQRADAEQAIRVARDRAETLLREVNHRVANSLGLVAAMVRMQASVVGDPSATRALQETQARISAIAGVHRHLYTSSDVGQVELARYLSHLIGELSTSLSGNDGQVAISIDMEDIRIATDRAVAIGVIVGELVTNAFKYAFIGTASGKIRVSLAGHGDGRASIEVSDDGIGFTPSQPAQGTGLGSRILKSMAKTLGAEVVYRPLPRGTTVTVIFPLAAAGAGVHHESEAEGLPTE